MAKREVMINLARLSYPVFGEPEDYNGNKKFRWGAGFWVPKTDVATIGTIDKTIREIAAEAWPKNHVKALPEILLDRKGCCWLDGARRNEAAAADYWTLTSYRYQKDGRPLIVDNDMTAIYNADNSFQPGKAGRLYAGCWVRGKIELWTQGTDSGNGGDNGRGIRAGLLTVQFVKKGDAFGGAGAVTTEGFGAVEDGSDADEIAD